MNRICTIRKVNNNVVTVYVINLSITHKELASFYPLNHLEDILMTFEKKALEISEYFCFVGSNSLIDAHSHWNELHSYLYYRYILLNEIVVMTNYYDISKDQQFMKISL